MSRLKVSKTKKNDSLKKLLMFLKSTGEDGKSIACELKNVKSLDQENAHATLFKLILNLDFLEEKAKKYWEQIVKHKDIMEKQLKRDIGIRVSMVDFFLNIDKQLINPKLIEISLYNENEKLVTTDVLTGLFNYHCFCISLPKEIDQSRRIGIPLTVLLLDIDNFKSYNDMFGRVNGDQLLRTVSNILSYNIRDSDSIFRYGGEEFAVILTNTDKEGAMISADRLLSAVKKFNYKDEKLPLDQPVTLSCGVASYPVDGKDFDILIENADKALYKAKYDGKDRAYLFSEERRRYFRFDLNCEMDYEPLVVVKGLKNGKLTNISEGGIAFLSMDFIAPKTDLKIKIHIEDSGEPLEVIGRVVRLVNLKKNEKYNYKVSFEFVKLDNNLKSKITQFVQKREKLKKS